MIRRREFRGQTYPGHFRFYRKFRSPEVELHHGQIIGELRQIFPKYVHAFLVWIETETMPGQVNSMSEQMHTRLFGDQA